jgi:hypothetical protein
MEITCRTGKLVVEGLQGSYGPQKLTVYAMKPEMGPPDREVFEFDPVDVSWAAEWDSVRAAIASGEPAADLDSVRYCWELIEQAYAANGYPTPGGAA